MLFKAKFGREVNNLRPKDKKQNRKNALLNTHNKPKQPKLLWFCCL